MNISLDPPYDEIIRRLLDSWNSQSHDVLRDFCTKDVVLRSPRLASDARGIDSVIAAVTQSRRTLGRRELVDVLVEDGRLVIALSHAGGLVTWKLTVNSDDKITEIVTAHGAAILNQGRYTRAITEARKAAPPRVSDLDRSRKSAILRLLDAWNGGEDLRDLLTEDVALTDATLGAKDHKLIGNEAVARSGLARRTETGRRDLIDVLLEGDKIILLLRYRKGFVTWRLTFRSDGKICEIVTAHGVGLFDPPDPPVGVNRLH